MTKVVAIDLGGTHMRTAVEGPDGMPAGVEAGPAPSSLADFVERVQALLGRHAATHLGIGIPGLARGTTCAWIPNLGFLDGLDLASAFPGLSVGLGNDAQLALLAEATAGAAKGRRDAILLSIGTGIGSAVLSAGRIVRGSRGAACSFGWACADLADAGSTRNGWLERQASGTALDAAARTVGLDDGRALIAAARQGQPQSRQALERPMHSLGTALAGAVALLDPEMIVVAGGVASEMDLLAPMIGAALDRQLPPHLHHIAMGPGHFGPGAGLVGAMIAGRQGPAWGEIDG